METLPSPKFQWPASLHTHSEQKDAQDGHSKLKQRSAENTASASIFSSSENLLEGWRAKQSSNIFFVSSGEHGLPRVTFSVETPVEPDVSLERKISNLALSALAQWEMKQNCLNLLV